MRRKKEVSKSGSKQVSKGGTQKKEDLVRNLKIPGTQITGYFT